MHIDIRKVDIRLPLFRTSRYQNNLAVGMGQIFLLTGQFCQPHRMDTLFSFKSQRK